jgi:hypothetical protein
VMFFFRQGIRFHFVFVIHEFELNLLSYYSENLICYLQYPSFTSLSLYQY